MYHNRLGEMCAINSFWRNAAGEYMKYADMIEYAGARRSSTDARWPLTFSRRPLRRRNFRKRTPGGAQPAPAEEDGPGLQTGLSGPQLQLEVFKFMGCGVINQMVSY